jgi:hypothetical protein
MQVGLGSGELEEYPDIFPGEQPRIYVDLRHLPLPEAIDVALEPIYRALEELEGRRNINLYGAKKTRRRRVMEHLFDRLLRSRRRRR